MTERIKYLKLLSKLFPTIEETATEIINLEAILSLPKGTEHFISDLHGEYSSFNHLLKNSSGVIKEKIEDIFSKSLSQKERNQLATIIYYPKEKIDFIKESGINMEIWYETTMKRLLKILEITSSKYTRSKVRKAISKDFSYIIQELLYERGGTPNKIDYIDGIFRTIISVDRGSEFIIALSELIQRLTVDSLHIIGDIYDRGPYPDKIMDTLMDYHNVDIQWGNHDILWLGAASGQLSCIANAIRISLRYGNTEILEEGYGINLLPLATLALEEYQEDCKENFSIRSLTPLENKNIPLLEKMHKAISIIQFKLEEELIKNNPEFNMNDRIFFDKINFETNTILLDGQTYPLKDSYLPTLTSLTLTKREKEVIENLKFSFITSEKLQKHSRFLLEKGSIYLKKNSNLLYHGCVPLDSKGKFRKIKILNKEYSGKNLFDYLDSLIRESYYNSKDGTLKDIYWYLWCGPDSPLFGKDKMRTFERYFLDDKALHKEKYDFYYEFYEDESILNNILLEFGLKIEGSNIVSGHVPVKVKKGEKPTKGNGKLLLIDGGFSKAYHSTTGIAGYTLIFNSYGKRLVSHFPFNFSVDSIEGCLDMPTSTAFVEIRNERLKVKDTDIGVELSNQIADLKDLLDFHRGNLI